MPKAFLFLKGHQIPGRPSLAVAWNWIWWSVSGEQTDLELHFSYLSQEMGVLALKGESVVSKSL